MNNLGVGLFCLTLAGCAQTGLHGPEGNRPGVQALSSEARSADAQQREASPLPALPATSSDMAAQVLDTCRASVVESASLYDPVGIDVMSAGSVENLTGGGQIAPILVRIAYGSSEGYEARQASILCHLDSRGSVVSLSEGAAPSA